MHRNKTLTEFSELKPIVISHNRRMKIKPNGKAVKEDEDKVLTWFF